MGEMLAVAVLAAWGAYLFGRRSAFLEAHRATEQSRLFALLTFIAARTQGGAPCYVEDMVETLQRFSIVRDQEDLLDLLERAEARQWIRIYTPTIPRETVIPMAYTMTNLGLTALGIARADWLRRPKPDSVR